jgi:hypothetical protein
MADGRGAPVLVQLQADGAGLDLLAQAPAGRLALPLPMKPRFIGKPSAACSMRSMFQGPGRAGGGEGAGGGTGAAAEHGGDAGGQRLLDLLRADEVDVAVDAAGGDDRAFAADDLGAGADDDVDAGLGVGVAGLADGGDAAALQADVGLDDAPVVEDQRVGQHRVHRAFGPLCAATAPCRRGWSCRRRTSPLRRSRRRARCSRPRPRSPSRCRPGARGRPWSGRTSPRRRGGDRCHLRAFLGPGRGSRSTTRSPARSTSSTVRCWPGSKRTAVPEAMFSRMPRAAARSKRSAPLVSAK